jgi:3-deoxy-D-manno-octulosonic-acid transferase
VNSIGQLSYLYRYATLAYIGGGFGKGIHNTLEAATYGVPVIFGPRYQKFREARELISLGGAFSVANEAEMLFTFRQQLDMNTLLKSSSEIAQKYVREGLGATDLILDKLCISTS